LRLTKVNNTVKSTLNAAEQCLTKYQEDYTQLTHF